MIGAVLWLTGDAGGWAAEKLLAPSLTGLFVGLALRYSAVVSEVVSHGERAAGLDTDITRWVADRSALLDAAINRAANLAKQGVIEDSVPPPLPQRLVATEPGSQLDSGAFLRRVERLMRQALHEYRDQASGSVRTFRAMARSEGWFHRLVRRVKRERKPTALRLAPTSRDMLASWRQRQAPAHDSPTVTVQDDPTMREDANDIRPLESKAGITWDAARAQGP